MKIPFFTRKQPLAANTGTMPATQLSATTTLERPNPLASPRREQRNTAPAVPPATHSAPSATATEDAPAKRRRRGGRGRGASSISTAPAIIEAKLPPLITPISEAFKALGVDATGLRAIAALGFDTPTPIQQEALPAMLAGEDVVGLAQTGTGKTLAFGLPLARKIDPAHQAVQAIILIPTRELAHQVHEVIDHLGSFYGFVTLGLVGGRRVRSDMLALEQGAHVIVGTPGRVIDHLERGTLRLNDVHFVVLDEADQMLDIGFARDIDRILRHAPKARQTALFSATMPMSIARIVHRYMRKAVEISVTTPEQRTAEGVLQYFCEVPERDKFYALRHLYETTDLGRSLIFRRTKAGVDRLTAQLQSCGVPARAIHGDLAQGERDRVMADFRGGTLQFLIATNVAARGLDIPDIHHVINFDVPQNPDEYIHRIGRTARAGKSGSAITFVSEWELAEWDAVAHVVGADALEEIPMPTRWV